MFGADRRGLNRHRWNGVPLLYPLSYIRIVWSGRQDLNLRHLASKARTLTRLSYTQRIWQCESDSNRHLLDRQSNALPIELPHLEELGGCCQPRRMGLPFACRLLGGQEGHRLRTGAPLVCTITLACKTRVFALSVVSHDWRCCAAAGTTTCSRTAHRFTAIPAGRGLGRSDLPGTRRQAAMLGGGPRSQTAHLPLATRMLYRLS